MSIKISGCAKVCLKKRYVYKYATGANVYFCPKARKGVLEKITIKEVMLRFVNGNDRIAVALYQDTLNSLYNENELCSHAQALLLARTYYEQKAIDLQTLMAKEKCGTKDQ